MARSYASSKKNYPYSATVYCLNCNRIAPIDRDKPVDESGDPVYLWHQPCPNCGQEMWATKLVQRRKRVEK